MTLGGPASLHTESLTPRNAWGIAQLKLFVPPLMLLAKFPEKALVCFVQGRPPAVLMSEP